MIHSIGKKGGRRAALDRWAGRAMWAVAMALAARLRVGGLAAPVAAAWFCASLDGRGRPWALWAGLAAGSLLALGDVRAAALPLAGLLAMVAAPGGWSAPGRAALAGALALTDALAASRMDVDAAPLWLAGSLLALAASVPMLALRRSGAAWGETGGIPAAGFVGLVDGAPAAVPRAPLSNGRAAALGRALLHAAVPLGAAALGRYWGLLAAGVSVALWSGAGGMALATLLAASLGALGEPLAEAAALCAMGAGMEALRRWGCVAAALGGLASAGLWLLAGGAPDAVRALAALAPAGAVAALRPMGAGGHTAARRAWDARRGMEWQAGRIRRRLTAMSELLSELARGYGSGLDPPGEDEVLSRLRARLCDGCARYGDCWNGRAGEGIRLMCELIADSASGTLPERASPDMMRRCGRADAIPERLYGILTEYAARRSARLAQLDGAQRARLSIRTAAELVSALADACEAPDVGGPELRRLERDLRRLGLGRATALRASDGLALISPDGWNEFDVRRARDACERAWRRRWSASADGTVLAMRLAPELRAAAGWDGRALEEASGDSVRIGALDERGWMVAISDGMGTGTAAAGESALAVDAVERLLRAGIPPERAAALANRLLLNEGRADMFATLDLCVVDLWRRRATFVKMAAYDSWLVRGGEVRVAAGGKLPMGILPDAAPQVVSMDVQPGDVIVMGTDGAMEGLDRQALAREVAARGNEAARELARALRRAGEGRRAHADDQTLAVIRIEAAREGERAFHTADEMAADRAV